MFNFLFYLFIFIKNNNCQYKNCYLDINIKNGTLSEIYLDNDIIIRKDFNNFKNGNLNKKSFSTYSNHILKFKFNSKNMLIAILISCDNIHFSSLYNSQNFFPKLIINKNEKDNLFDLNHNIIINDSYYFSLENSTELIFRFPYLYYFFPSQIIKLNLNERGNISFENISKNINRTISILKNNIIDNQIIYQNFENQNEWFYIIINNNDTKIIYFMSYCISFKKNNKNNIFKCETFLPCKKVKKLKLNSNEYEIKCKNISKKKNENNKETMNNKNYLNESKKQLFLIRRDSLFETIITQCPNFQNCDISSKINLNHHIKVQLLTNFLPGNTGINYQIKYSDNDYINYYNYKYDNNSILESWEKCCIIQHFINPSNIHFIIDRNSSNYIIYNENGNTLDLYFCDLEELYYCDRIFSYTNESNFISVTCSSSFSRCNDLFSNNHIKDKIELKLICDFYDELIFHNYDKYDRKNAKNWEICSHIIYLKQNLDYIKVKFSKDDYNDYTLFNLDNQEDITDTCKIFFDNCQEVKVLKKYGVDYIYCYSYETCDMIKEKIFYNTLKSQIFEINLNYEIYCDNVVINLHHYKNKFDNEIVKELEMGENWEICTYIYYLFDKNNFQIQRKKYDSLYSDNEKINYTIKLLNDNVQEFDNFLCNFSFLIYCNLELTYDEINKKIICKTDFDCEYIREKFKPEPNNDKKYNLYFNVHCENSVFQYYYYDNYVNDTSDGSEKCSYLLNLNYKFNNYYRVEMENQSIYNNNDNQKLKSEFCNYSYLIHCNELNFGNKENINYVICNTSRDNFIKIKNEIDLNSFLNLDLKLYYEDNFSFYHYYKFYMEKKNKKWEACSDILNLYYNQKPEYFLINGENDEDNFKIRVINCEECNNNNNIEICFPHAKNKTFYGQINKNSTLYLNNDFIEPFFPNYSGFSFNNNNNNGKLYYYNYEIKYENNIFYTNTFEYEHKNENVLKNNISFNLYFNDIKLIEDEINILIFPNFCETNEKNFKENICLILKNDEEILDILIKNINSNIFENIKKIKGSNSEFTIITNDINDKCRLDLEQIYNLAKIYIIEKKENNNIENYYVSENNQMLNKELCGNFTINNLNVKIKNNLIINVNDLINPSIDFPKNFFKIKIIKEENIEGTIYNNNTILKENEFYNDLEINYIIKYKTCYYKDLFKIELYKNDEFQDTSLITLNIIPFFCENNTNICYSYYSNSYIIDSLHKNIKNITCDLGKVIYNINKNYIIQIYDINNNINKKLSRTISIGEECEDFLRKKYSLLKEDKIIVLLNDNTNNFFYELYNEKGEKLDISLCKSFTILNPINESIFNDSKISTINDLGYDPYDHKSPIYYDKCISLTDKGNDIILEDRVNDIYNTINPCLSYCEYKGLNKETGIIHCECKINLELNESKNNNKKKDNLFISTFKKINIHPIYCYQLLSQIKNIKKNLGFYIFSFFIIIQIVCFFALFFFDFIKLKSKIFQNDYQKKNSNLNIYNTFIYINKKKIIQSFFPNSSNSNSMILKRELKLSKKEHKKDFIIMNKYSYKNGIKNDKRPFTIIFIDILTDKILLLKGIIIKSPFHLRSLNISLFFLHLSIIFTLNGLFYTDQIISEKYHNNGLSLLTNFFKSFLSSLINVVIFSILNKLSDYIGKLYTLLNEYNDYNIYTIITYKFIQKMKKQFIIYFIIIILLTLLFLYYITLFCIIYKGSQKSWIEGAFISFLISNIFEIILCLLATTLRKISLTRKNQLLYNIYLFIINKI